MSDTLDSICTLVGARRRGRGAARELEVGVYAESTAQSRAR